VDNLTTAQRRKNMQSIRSKNTLPEVLIMRHLRKSKIYFSKHVKKLPGTPDVVLKKNKIAVFVDSEFWHGHPNKFIMPKSNRNYWKKKIEANRLRDRKVNKLLKKQGWKVLRFWEFQIKKSPMNCIKKIKELIS
jgi:DNA mismatch endonuclease, patch repair protein